MRALFNLTGKLNRYKKTILSLGLSLLFTAAFAQAEITKEAPSVVLNPLFLCLAGVIFLLLIIIIVLAGTVTGAAQNAADTDTKKNNITTILSIIALLIISSSGFAQNAAAPVVAADPNFAGLEPGIFYTMLIVIGIELIIITVLLNSVKLLLGVEERMAAEAEGKALEHEEELPALLDKLNASVSIEQEEDILMDHNYDGIRELDNNLPPWWKYGFYITIVFAVIYMYYFHVSHSGDLQIAEYNNEMKKAEADIAEYMKTAANMVDETNVKLLTDAENIAKGKDLFMDNCSACHGRQGQGQVGPNLTDDYWVHGGSIKDIFKTIKYGYPDKGMKSWKEEIGPAQIASIASFIKSIHGTNPAGAKAQQGELYVEQTAATDSTSIKTDPLQVKADTLKKVNQE